MAAWLQALGVLRPEVFGVTGPFRACGFRVQLYFGEGVCGFPDTS